MIQTIFKQNLFFVKKKLFLILYEKKILQMFGVHQNLLTYWTLFI